MRFFSLSLYSGRGQGRGFLYLRSEITNKKNPLPNPLPEYREREPELCASIQLRHHELPMPQRLGGGESAVRGADDDVDELVASLVERLFAAQDAADIVVNVLGHGGDGLGISG